MHFCYIDETGCTGSNLADPDQPVFVMGGVSVRDEGWLRTKREMDKLVSHFCGGSVSSKFEVHSAELLSENGHGHFHGCSPDERRQFAQDLLELLRQRKHAVHFIGLDKATMSGTQCDASVVYNPAIPYLLAYDYMITYLEQWTKDQLGHSARSMLILDEKRAFRKQIEKITHARRFEPPKTHQVRWVVEFSYPVSSIKNPMIQLSDLVIYCVRRFIELDKGLFTPPDDDWARFFVRAYEIIDGMRWRKTLLDRPGRGMNKLNDFIADVEAKPRRTWRTHYCVP